VKRLLMVFLAIIVLMSLCATAFVPTPVQVSAEVGADLTPPNVSYGYMPPPMNLSLIPEVTVDSKSLLTANPGLPYFDWRVTGNVTPVKNQAACGTCWAFGAISTIESGVLIAENISYDFSEQSVVCCTDPSITYLFNDRCGGGGDSYIAADTLIKEGIRLESCQPYNTDTMNTESCNASCTPVKVLTGHRLVTNNGSQIDKIKDAIYDYGPVSIAFTYNNSYYNASSHIFYWPSCTQEANHMVSIVGWNDSIPHPSGGGYGTWIVKNSWDTDWGDSGYFYLCYGSANMQEVVSYIYKDYDPNETLHYWDEAGERGYFGSPGYDYAWMASVFTPTHSGNITSADFWMPSSNAQYVIYIYDGNLSSTLLATQNGSCTESGYYSIPLNSPVHRNIGQQFTVAAKITTPGWNDPIAIEKHNASLEIDPPIQTGVSFWRLNDSDPWEDLASDGNNACLRARMVNDAPPVPSEVWVDDGYTDGGANDGHTWGYNAFDKIQDGINGVSGSIVHVAAGIYYENIVLKNGVELLGAGSATTIIDGMQNGSVITANNVGNTTRLDGFTITNGSATNGGGMYNGASSPTVTNCVFLNNSASYGGGMFNNQSSTAAIIIDHRCTNLSGIPQGWILEAKSDLHIAYGHTSHGSQVTDGMSGLVGFAGAQYAWNEGGTGGALDMKDGGLGAASDLGNPDLTAWESTTREYLASHPATNVVMWSWCGQVSYASSGDIDNYLGLMSGLESDYPGVRFVYMTGHTDGSGLSGNLHIRNQQIRDYCVTNHKILYDFEDIESYDPDGNYFGDKNVSDSCDYSGGNWAVEWQNSHVEGVDWYECSSAHSQPLNANLKAYAAWWLWARLAGWMHDSPTITNCIFLNNSTTNQGGGMYNYESSPTITNCTFKSNSARASGGGMWDYNSSPTTINCTFQNNSACKGGGMYNAQSSPTISNCTFLNNSAPFGGGGMLNVENSSPAITNCIFKNNLATNCGGGIDNFLNTSPVITNCIFWNNSAPNGSAISNRDNSSSRITNCVLWNDSSAEIYNDASTPVVTYCDVEGGYSGEGNINSDPLFANAEAGDFHLTAGSPCIDAGNNSATSIPATDFEGDARIIDGNSDGTATVDMGADEYVPAPIPGDLNGDGSCNIMDIVDICGHWAETGTPGGWIPEDLYEDGVIDIMDIVVVCNHWTG
jgi:C1A family cysteine protease